MLDSIVSFPCCSSLVTVARFNVKNTLRKLQQFLVSEDGPTAVEYAVMLALIVIVCLTAISAIGTKASTTFANISTSLG
jgi:pilus assembly protein Flp/PilA